jgi:uncharacterized protein
MMVDVHESGDRVSATGKHAPDASTVISRVGATLSAVLRWPARAITEVLILLIRLYQVTLSPLLGPACRFEPTCSRYMVESLRKYGILKGLGRGVRRVARCHPWNPGGYDPP